MTDLDNATFLTALDVFLPESESKLKLLAYAKDLVRDRENPSKRIQALEENLDIMMRADRRFRTKRKALDLTGETFGPIVRESQIQSAMDVFLRVRQYPRYDGAALLQLAQHCRTFQFQVRAADCGENPGDIHLEIKCDVRGRPMQSSAVLDAYSVCDNNEQTQAGLYDATLRRMLCEAWQEIQP